MHQKLSPFIFKTHLYVSYRDLFPEEPEPDVAEILSHYSRKSLINVALALDTHYGHGEFENCVHFFSECNKNQYLDIIRRFEKFKETSIYPNTDFYFCSSVTGLELLRYAYSVEDKDLDDFASDTFELELFKVVLRINQHTMCKYNAVEGIKKHELLYLINLCYVDLEKDLEVLAMQQYVYAYHFFKFIEFHDDKSRALLNAFEKYYQASWKEYILTLIAARTISMPHAGRLPKDLKCDIDHSINKSILDHILLDDSKPLKYASDSKEDREGNSDYRYFRESPILDGGDSYILYSSPLLLGKIYNSLYFDLSKINKFIPDKKDRVSSIRNLFTLDFIQESLLYHYIRESIHDGYEMFTEERMNGNYEAKAGELGAPDLVLIAHHHAVLFECKDIRLNGWVKEQKDYTLILNELKDKIIGSDADDHKGVGQLTGHLKNIRNRQFHWAPIGQGKKVYPVLVLSDPNVNQEGLNGIIQDSCNKSFYNKDMRKLSANRPLIVMTPMTLIKHAPLFRKKGFAYFFEQYNRFISTTHQYEISFEHYMGGNYGFDRKDLITKILEEIKN